MLVNSCPILNLHIPPITVSCALPGRVAWLHCVQFNPDGWQTISREPPTRTHFLSKVHSRSRRQEARKNMGLDMNYKAEVFVDTENLSREDWLSFRRKGIGGSDAAAIMGMSPFSTKRDLYYDKLGIQPVVDEEEDNWVAKEVGHRLEDLVAEIFSRNTGLKVYPVRKMFRHPLHPFMLADVDFFIDFPDGTKGILWI